MDASHLKEVCAEVAHIAGQAAAFIRSQVGQVVADQVESKERNSLVSYVDKKAEEILVNALTPLVPSPGFITEEDTVTNNHSEFTWIIDPLDGTTNFLQQIPIFSVSVALIHHHEAVLGCVVDIMQDETYTAWRGGGAWCNGKPIHVSQTSELSEAIIATGFPYHKPGALVSLVDVFQGFLARARGIRRLGSAALDLTYVACGKMDGFYETTLNAWDVAAGTILVREAGGIVSDFEGKGEFVSKQAIVASNALLHDTMLAILSEGAVIKE
ncbi:MAG: inositol monophosphatase family protein [Saprospiraceae bacterium]|nr:inositol monophosphatase family protein [Saprospiraceae bacterium]